MKFATLIRESGLNCENFPETTLKIPIFLYDGKNRLCTDDVHYSEPLFKENINSLLNFKHFISRLKDQKFDSINVMIDESSVILFHNSARKISLSRTYCMDFYDYMQ